MRAALILLPLALAACGAEGTGNDSGPAAPPVAAAAPPAGTTWVETVAETPEGGFRMGNPNAPIKLVEYGSRTCPACAAFARDGFEPLTKLVETGKVSFEFRDYVLHGPPDIAAAVVGSCAGPGPFFPILEQMYANQAPTLERIQQVAPALQQQAQGASPAQQVSLWAEQAGYIDFVKQRGISESQAEACVADTARIEKVAKILESATVVQGTPTFLLNGNKLENAISWSDVQAALRRAGA